MFSFFNKSNYVDTECCDGAKTIHKSWLIFLLIPSLVVLVGNWLTGFNNVSWVSWLPVFILPIGSITHWCPGFYFVHSIRKQKYIHAIFQLLAIIVLFLLVYVGHSIII
jgi:hypothetical protein